MVFQRAKRVWLVFLRAIARLYGFIILAPLLFEGRPPPPLSEAMHPFYTTLGTEGRRPDGCHTPLCREAAGPYGNAAAPPTGIYCHWRHLLHAPRSFAALRMTVARRGCSIPVPIPIPAAPSGAPPIAAASRLLSSRTSNPPGAPYDSAYRVHSYRRGR